MSHEVFWVFRVLKNAVMHIHSMALKVRPRLFNSSTSLQSQCIIFFPSLWIPCIYIIVLILGVRHALPQIFYPRVIDYQGKFIGGLLCVHSPGGFIEGRYP